MPFRSDRKIKKTSRINFNGILNLKLKTEVEMVLRDKLLILNSLKISATKLALIFLGRSTLVKKKFKFVNEHISENTCK